MAGHLLLYLTYRIGEARTVAPFMYTLTIWAVLSGLVVFGDIPNTLAIAGMVLVTLAGLAIIWLDGRQRRQDARLALETQRLSREGRLRRRQPRGRPSGPVIADQHRRLRLADMARLVEDRRHLGVGDEVLPALGIPVEHRPDAVGLGSGRGTRWRPCSRAGGACRRPWWRRSG